MSKNAAHLPKWPELDIDEEQELCRVSGKHITLRRLGRSRYVCILIWLFCFGLAIVMNEEGSTFGTIALVCGPLIAFSFFIVSKTGTKWLCQTLYPQRTEVYFDKDAVYIGRTSYPLKASVHIEFNCDEPELDQEKQADCHYDAQKGRFGCGGLYPLKHRKLQMIYGLSPVKITDMEDKKAMQFVTMLQFAYEYSQAVRNRSQTEEVAAPAAYSTTTAPQQAFVPMSKAERANSSVPATPPDLPPQSKS
jgi:hypothetical protein